MTIQVLPSSPIVQTQTVSTTISSIDITQIIFDTAEQTVTANYDLQTVVADGYVSVSGSQVFSGAAYTALVSQVAASATENLDVFGTRVVGAAVLAMFNTTGTVLTSSGVAVITP